MYRKKCKRKKILLIHARHAAELINFTEVVAALEEVGESKGGGKMREVVVEEDVLLGEVEMEDGVATVGKFLYVFPLGTFERDKYTERLDALLKLFKHPPSPPTPTPTEELFADFGMIETPPSPIFTELVPMLVP